MDRLKRNFPITTFKRCQLCGYTSTYGVDGDICEFRMHNECDEQDKPEPGNVLITCKQPACQKLIKDHPRLYIEVPWGQGGPGRFMLLCGDCKYRNQSSCTHPDLKDNGGNGLELKFAKPLGDVRVCFQNGTSTGNAFMPAVECAGREKV